jgi:hypothetical protein
MGAMFSGRVRELLVFTLHNNEDYGSESRRRDLKKRNPIIVAKYFH